MLPPQGQDAAAVAASGVPPLDGGPDDHASEATHAVTLAHDGQTLALGMAAFPGQRALLRGVDLVSERELVNGR